MRLNPYVSYPKLKGMPPFIDSLTGLEFPIVHPSITVVEVASVRSQNGIPNPDAMEIESEVNDHICKNLTPKDRLKYCLDDEESRGAMRTFWGATAYAKIKALRASAFVPASEAERRAEICVGCKLNGDREIKFADRMMSNAVEGRNTPHDSKLKSCLACKCPLKPKVHVSGEIISSTITLEDSERMPGFCWQKKIFRDNNGSAESDCGCNQ